MMLPIIEAERIKRRLTKDELAQMLGVKKELFRIGKMEKHKFHRQNY